LSFSSLSPTAWRRGRSRRAWLSASVAVLAPGRAWYAARPRPARIGLGFLALAWLAGLLAVAVMLPAGLLSGGAASAPARSLAVPAAAAADPQLGDSLAALTTRLETLEREREALLARVITIEAALAPAEVATGASALSSGAAAAVAAGLTLDTGGRDLYNCNRFGSWEQAQAVYQASGPGDPNHIDGDGNGAACEVLR